jgi:DNA-binding NarL/FixJ family response regulator
MDLVMPKLNGLEATRKIHELSPSARVLILTLHENPVLPKIAQDSGANGYVVKSESFDTLTRAIEFVGESNRFFVAH